MNCDIMTLVNYAAMHYVLDSDISVSVCGCLESGVDKSIPCIFTIRLSSHTKPDSQRAMGVTRLKRRLADASTMSNC